MAAAKSAGPWLVMAAGAATAAAGVFRRDHMLLTGPGWAGESWHNQVHDVFSGVAYGAMLAAPLVLGRRFRADPDWAGLARPVQVFALASAVAMAVFASVLALVRAFDDAGKPIAFICHAGWVPISAKIVKGRRATSVAAIRDNMVNAGVNWVDQAAVVDGNLLSARTPADLGPWMKALLAALDMPGS